MTSFEKLLTPLLRGLCCSICIEACQLEHFYQLEAIDKLTCQKMRDTPENLIVHRNALIGEKSYSPF